MSEAAFQFSTTLLSFGPCGVCGIVFAGPENYVTKRREDHGTFYCPNGHVLSFGKGKIERLEQELATANEKIALERKRTEWARTDVENQKRVNAALRGEITKVKKRVGRGTDARKKKV